ncbi:MAG: DUF6600 domain-containing protein [Bacteroidota bacterium]
MRSSRILTVLVALITGAWLLPQQASAQQGSVSFQVFYDELSPHGVWVDYPRYGYVWIPNGDPGFSPYATAGHWVYTEYGWTWVSDYPWGWATFHYGRWDFDDTYGWFWVPDDEWGPAWVSWRRSPGYYGWAPLRPGISLSISFGGGNYERSERWIFVRDGDISRSDVSSRYINRSRNVTIINNSSVIINTRKDNRRNVTYVVGPDRDDVQRATRTTITSVAIRENDKPGRQWSNGELHIYRPQVQKRSANGQSPAPTRVMNLNDVKPAKERNADNRQREVQPAKKGRIGQQPESPTRKPSGGKETRPQNVATPDKSRKAQPLPPRTNQNERKNKKRE